MIVSSGMMCLHMPELCFTPALALCAHVAGCSGFHRFDRTQAYQYSQDIVCRLRKIDAHDTEKFWQD